MNIEKKILIIFSVVFLGMAPDNWTLEFVEEGISVYTKDIPGSALRAFKAEGKIYSSIETVNSILCDSQGQVKWMPDSIVSYGLINDNNSYLVSYNETKVPVVNNRDVIIETRIIKSNNRIVHKYQALDRPDLVPEFKGKVRITEMNGSWELLSSGDTTHVVFEVKANPGGIVPVWLANMASRDIPYKTMLGLRAMAKER